MRLCRADQITTTAYSMDFHRHKLIRYKESECNCKTNFQATEATSHQSYISFTGFQLSTAFEFKILLLTFKAIHGMALDYICKLISRKSLLRYSLRSSQRIMLQIPSGRILSILGGRAFCYAAPKLWNNVTCPARYLALTRSQV